MTTAGRLTAFAVESIEPLSLPAKQMTSGAGHDAMAMPARVPTAMLFLRSRGEVSRHADETARGEDVEIALRVVQKFVERLAADFG